MNEVVSKVKYWMNVASNDHVQVGTKIGITQSCHGKAAPLKRMHKGDWLIHYSPKEHFQGNESCKKFTSLGQVSDNKIYQFDMGNDFIPWRRNINYLDIRPVSILNLLETLSFTKGKGKHWGMVFRFGFFEIPESDFKFLYKEMAGLDFLTTNKHPFLDCLGKEDSKTLEIICQR